MFQSFHQQNQCPPLLKVHVYIYKDIFFRCEAIGLVCLGGFNWSFVYKLLKKSECSAKQSFSVKAESVPKHFIVIRTYIHATEELHNGTKTIKYIIVFTKVL